MATVLFSVAACGVFADDKPAAPKLKTVDLNGHTFTLPPGFEIELVAGPPLVDRPITADFDEQGRLYVSDSSGSNEKVQDQLAKKPHRILRLEDTDGDGRFDKRTIFADGMMFPEGTMWLAGSLYVAAPPSIWKLTDTDGDGVADKREEWFKGQTMTGCANDLHGPYAGPDGWIYWCKGAFAKQTYERPGKPPFVTRASHIFRCRPDGSGLEAVMTGGMDNPVDVVFTPGGERIFTTTFFQFPAGGRRDGLIHAVYGGIYGKDHDPIYEHPWTSPHLMPVLTHLGPAAPAGLHRFESESFGEDYKDNLFACNFNLHKITRHVLIPDGASFRTKDEDFLVSNNVDFHPTDVIEDADGSLLVVDTGGWYKLCCPSSQFHKPDVLGAIYRVRKTGATKIDDPRRLQLDWAHAPVDSLAAKLDDLRPAVRRRAIEALAAKGEKALGVLSKVLSSDSARGGEARQNAIWTACRIDLPAARALVRSALTDGDEGARQVALHAVSLWRDREALPTLLLHLRALPAVPNPEDVANKTAWSLIRSRSYHNVRAAAEAIGRMGDKVAIPALLRAAGEPADRALENSLTYALIEIADRETTAAGLTSPNPRVRRAALAALDQMPGGKLDVAAVTKELAAADPALKETAWWIAGRHPEWAGELTGVLRERLTAKALAPAEQDELAKQLALFAKAAPAQQLLAELLGPRGADATPLAKRVILRAMAKAGLREAPAPWITTVADVLRGNDAELTGEAVATARALRWPRQRPEHLVTALKQISGNSAVPAGVRLNALAAVPGALAGLEPATFDFLRSQLAPEQPVATRSAAADVLSRAKLSREQLLALAECVKNAGPLEIDRLLDAFAASTDSAVGHSLIAAMKASPGRAAVRIESLKPRLSKYGNGVTSEAEELYALLTADNAGQREKLDKLVAALSNGDVRRGQAVFHSPKAACSSCHATGYVGGRIGPDLTKIGSIRTERDLLESIVFPSASFVRSFEPVQVVTKAGKVHNGLVRQDQPDEIVLTMNADTEVHVARDDIESVQPGTVSIMPSGLDQQLSPQELSDLIAFLKACK
ncbi:MAG TPA: PVC-type heme-binding CxxCH protein [Gemmataceae bacterium]|nr:PVC-type heme-binding CxxCH protein [Gemmataceae bacterium]